MEVKDALLKRRSVRKFKEDKVSEEIINELHYLAYHCNKKDVMLEKDYREEKFF